MRSTAQPYRRGRSGKQRGAAMIEAALVMVFLFALIFLLIDLAWAVFAKVTLQNAVRAGVRYAITSQTGTDPNTGLALGQVASIKQVVQTKAMGLHYHRVRIGHRPRFAPSAHGGHGDWFNLIRAIQANQMNRIPGTCTLVEWISRQITGAGKRDVLTYMAPRLAGSSGTGIVVLSEFQYVGPNTCKNCANTGNSVFLQQLTIGNSALMSSHFGAVPAGSMNQDGTGTVINPYTDPAVQANGILGVLPMTDGDLAYVSETYFSSTDFDIAGFLSPSGIYCRAIF